MLSTLLLAVLVAAPHVASPSLDLSGGARVATYSGALDWSRSWATDWGAAIAGMPSPTISCEADADSFDCTGATATPVGSPTYVTAAGYPERWGTAISGSNQHYTLGDTADASAALTVMAVFERSNAGGYAVDKYTTTAGDSSYTLYDTGAGSWSLRVCSAPGSCSSSTSLALAASTIHVCACAYSYVTSGTSVLGCNCDGTESGVMNTAVGPIANSETVLSMGRALAGRLVQGAVWPAYAATATQRATLVASQQARLAAKPVGALVTVTSGATKAWGASGTVYSLPANSLAPSPTGAGMEIWSAAQHSNALPTSTTAGWTGNAGAASDVGVNGPTTVADAAGPDGSATSATTITAGVNGSVHYASQIYTGTAVAWTFSAYMKAGTATWGAITADLANGTYVNLATCTLGAAAGSVTSRTAEWAPGGTWCRVSVTLTSSASTKQFGINICEADSDCSFSAAGTETLTFYAPQAQIGVTAGPPTPSAGTPVVGSGDLPTVASTGVTQDCIGFTATLSDWNPASAVYLMSVGTFNASPSAFIATSAGSTYLRTKDAAGNTLDRAFTPPTDGAEAKIVACMADNRVWVNGAESTSATSGSGVGIAAMPTAVYIGALSIGAQANGAFRKVCQSKDFAGCRKALQ